MGAEEAEEVEEEVDEVEVEIEGAEGGDVAGGGGGHHFGHALDLLGVPGGEAHKDGYAGKGGNPIDAYAMQEEVDHRGDNQADKGHEEDGADFAQVLVGSVTIDAHGTKRGGANHEGAED